jgi:hypothetical protein
LHNRPENVIPNQSLGRSFLRAVVPLNAAEPVFGKLVVPGYGMDQDAEVRLYVNEFEGEVSNEAAPRSGGAGLAVKWKRGCQLGSLFDLGAETSTEPLSKRLVVSGLG